MLRLFARFATGAPRRVLAGGLAVLVIAVALSTMAFAKLQGGGFDDPKADSIVAQQQLNDRFGGSPDLLFLVTAKQGDVDSPAVTERGLALAQALGSNPDLDEIVSYWVNASDTLKSKDNKSALVMAHVKGSEADSESTARALIKTYATNNDVVSVKAGGYQTINIRVTDQVTKDLAVAEGVAIPLTLILLVLAFGSVVAALLPLVIGVVAIFGTLAALWFLGSVTDVSIYSLNLTTSLGLGLGVDYALLMVSRFREELAAGSEVADAVRTTLRTAGHTIVFSAGTVALALGALLVFPPFFLRSFAYAGIAVVLIAMLAAILVLPALLMILGPRVNKWKLPRMQLNGGESGFWHRLASIVVRRPIVAAVPVLAVVALLALPVLHVNFATPDDQVLPDNYSSHQVGDALRDDFASDDNLALFAVLTGNPTDANLNTYALAVSRVADVQRVATTTGTYVAGQQVSGPTPMNAQYKTNGSTYLDVVSEGDFTTDAAQQVVDRLRTLTPPPATSLHLGGPAATLVDEKHAISNHLPLAIAWIVISTLILLFAYTGSVLLPLKALVLNGLTMAAVMGTMTWIFQEGHLSGLLGFTARPLDTSMPVLLFCVAFGLSMDYEVFLLSRIKEAHDRGASDREAVVSGLAHTGRIVSTAAGLLAVSFIAFGTSRVVFIQMFGIGTAMAILVDATLVRGVLVPAFMRLAGRANWWAPKFLRRSAIPAPSMSIATPPQPQ